jgi:RNA polymerase sigma factor (sigma-70 family)
MVWYKTLNLRKYPMPPSEQTSGIQSAQHFATTRWTVVERAWEHDSPEAVEALAWLCQAYWYPLYAHVRRRGYMVEDAKDLTQSFFARLLKQKYLQFADRNRGRFRTFLLTSLEHFVINEWNTAHRQKRGGGQQIISLDADETETRFRAEPADDLSPDKAFDRRWALVVLNRALDQLRDEYASIGQVQVFEELKFTLTGEEGGESYTEIGQRLGMTEGNVKQKVYRLRKRYRELVREEIAKTVSSEAIDEEMRHLFAALSN